MESILALTLLMAAVTALPRLIPIWFLPRRQLPLALSTWLRYIPISIIAAILGPQLFLKEGNLFFSPSNFFLWAAIPTFVVGLWRKNLALTILTGMAALALLRYSVGS